MKDGINPTDTDSRTWQSQCPDACPYRVICNFNPTALRVANVLKSKFEIPFIQKAASAVADTAFINFMLSELVSGKLNNSGFVCLGLGQGLGFG